MAGQRQPIALVQAKGKKHLTKAEIAERERTEVKAPSDRVTPPSYPVSYTHLTLPTT